MNTIKIINPGIFTTIQDLGRYGYQQYGMPVSGAMDTYSLRAANLLVGNEMNAACFEATYSGPTIQVLSDTIIGAAGCKFTLRINNQVVNPSINHKVLKDDILSFESFNNGCRLYIAFYGGIDVPKVMGSRSTYLRAKLSGYNGRILQPNDELKTIQKKLRFKKRELKSHHNLIITPEHQTLRVIGGTEVKRFSIEGIKTFLTNSYSILPQSDRMGYRLGGLPIQHLDGADIISSGISNGAIQVPGDGQPIIMLADRQTTGGYTKIANVITADLPILGQLKPGNTLKFEQIHLEEAHKLLIQQHKIIKSI